MKERTKVADQHQPHYGAFLFSLALPISLSLLFLRWDCLLHIDSAISCKSKRKSKSQPCWFPFHDVIIDIFRSRTERSGKEWSGASDDDTKFVCFFSSWKEIKLRDGNEQSFPDHWPCLFVPSPIYSLFSLFGTINLGKGLERNEREERKKKQSERKQYALREAARA